MHGAQRLKLIDFLKYFFKKITKNISETGADICPAKMKDGGRILLGDNAGGGAFVSQLVSCETIASMDALPTNRS